MCRRTPLRLLMVFFAALWLPLQAVAGLVMPIYMVGSGPGGASKSAVASNGDHCHHAEIESDVAPTSLNDDDCVNSCALCHFASVGFLLPAAVPAVQLMVWRDHAPRAEQNFPRRSTEPPQRPPRLI